MYSWPCDKLHNAHRMIIRGRRSVLQITCMHVASWWSLPKLLFVCFPKIRFWKQIGSDSLLVRLIPSEKVVLFVWTKCSKTKFTFHFFKAISVTTLRPSCSRPFSQLMAPQAAQVRCITEHITVCLTLFCILRTIYRLLWIWLWKRKT